MRYLIIASLIVVFCDVAQAANASAPLELAKLNGCLSCHAAKEKVVGPAFSTIASKYKDDQNAVAQLAHSIQYGSKGKWGRIPMPGHLNMSDSDINSLARWIMSH